VRIVEGPVIPPPPVAEVVAEDVAKAEESVDFVILVLVRLPFLFGVEGSSLAAALSSAWAWERTFKRRRWWARLLRAESEDEENLEKKIVSRRWGVWDARYADVRINVEKYGRDGRADGAGFDANGARKVLIGADESSGTIRCTSADSP
jgi:hypothetical protein